jgi:hypothetical protein
MIYNLIDDVIDDANASVVLFVYWNKFLTATLVDKDRWMIMIYLRRHRRWMMIKIYWRWMIEISTKFIVRMIMIYLYRHRWWMMKIIHKIYWRWMMKIIHIIYWRWMIQFIEDEWWRLLKMKIYWRWMIQIIQYESSMWIFYDKW